MSAGIFRAISANGHVAGLLQLQAAPSGKATEKDSFWLRYQYNRQIRKSGRIIFGDNFGVNNNRQYNLGFTATHVFSPRQVGEFRYGFGNRSTLQDVADDNAIPTIRFASTLCGGANVSLRQAIVTNPLLFVYPPRL